MTTLPIAAAGSGLLIGAAAGLLLTETAGAAFAFLISGADGTGVPTGAFVAVTLLCAVLGAVVAVRHGRRWTA